MHGYNDVGQILQTIHRQKTEDLQRHKTREVLAYMAQYNIPNCKAYEFYIPEDYHYGCIEYITNSTESLVFLLSNHEPLNEMMVSVTPFMTSVIPERLLTNNDITSREINSVHILIQEISNKYAVSFCWDHLTTDEDFVRISVSLEKHITKDQLPPLFTTDGVLVETPRPDIKFICFPRNDNIQNIKLEVPHNESE